MLELTPEPLALLISLIAILIVDYKQTAFNLATGIENNPWIKRFGRDAWFAVWVVVAAVSYMTAVTLNVPGLFDLLAIFVIGLEFSIVIENYKRGAR